jgi:hypothetical protein
MRNNPGRGRTVLVLVLFATISFLYGSFLPWGFFAHRKINQLAVFTLPPELIGPFKKNVEYLTIHSVDPDKRRYAFRQEAVRHYIDLDMYGGVYPPESWEAALSKYLRVLVLNSSDTTPVNRQILGDSIQLSGPCDTLTISKNRWDRFIRKNILYSWENLPFTLDNNQIAEELGIKIGDESSIWFSEAISYHGVLPWHLQKVYRQLINDMKSGNIDRIMKTAADLGHYIGDAHVPLHTSSNYNGQKTGQYGIHAFWESRIPELFADESYDLLTGPASYIAEPDSFFWDIVLTSHSLVDSVLWAENEASITFPEHGQYCLEKRGASIVRVPCRDYTRTFSELMGTMVETRMRDAIHAIGSAWYSAWIDAGQPALLERSASIKDSAVMYPTFMDKSLTRPHESGDN